MTNKLRWNDRTRAYHSTTSDEITALGNDHQWLLKPLGARLIVNLMTDESG